MINKITHKILEGNKLSREDDISFLINGSLSELSNGADEIRKKFCGNHIDLCTIINGRSGRCSENCKYCAQSEHYCTNIEEYEFLNEDKIVSVCKSVESDGVHRFSVVTSGRSLSDKDFTSALKAYKNMQKECSNIELCASHGLLTEEQFRELKASGVFRYHANIETSRRFFPQICTTHTYDDKIACIKAAQRAGLSVCSGGIIGLGENWEDRIDMAFSLQELGIESIPINVLIPIKGTPLQNQKPLSEDDIIRTIVIFRYINPTAYIRLAGGRALMQDSGRHAFHSGANAAITGNMLTTSGNNIKQDLEMLSDEGFYILREIKV